MRAFRFELSRVQTRAVRERVVAMIANVAPELAEGVAAGLGMRMPAPLPRVLEKVRKPEVTASPALSLLARPGDGSIRTRRIAILLADGADGEAARKIHERLSGEGAVPRFVGPQLGSVQTADGEALEVEVTLEATPAVLYDALAVTLGREACQCSHQRRTCNRIHQGPVSPLQTYPRHGCRQRPVESAGVPATLPSGKPDPGLIRLENGPLDDGIAQFIAAIAKHRHFARETDPPAV